MTAAECIGDKEPHDRDAASVVLTAQSAESESKEDESKSEQHSDDSASPAENSASSISYSTVMTTVLAVVGFSSYFI